MIACVCTVRYKYVCSHTAVIACGTHRRNSPAQVNPHVQMRVMYVAPISQTRAGYSISVYPHPAITLMASYRVFCPALGQQCKYNTRTVKTVDSYDDALMVQKLHLMQSSKHQLSEHDAQKLIDANPDYIESVDDEPTPTPAQVPPLPATPATTPPPCIWLTTQQRLKTSPLPDIMRRTQTR